MQKTATTKTEVVIVNAEKGATTGEGGTEGEGQNNVNEKQKSGGTGKKCPFNFCRSKKCAVSGEGAQGENAETDQQNQPTFQFNMVQRDDRKLQEVGEKGK